MSKPKTVTYGTAGGHATKLAAVALARAVGWALVALTSAVVVAATLYGFVDRSFSVLDLAFGAGALAGLIVAWAQVQTSRDKYRKANVGARSERRVAKAIAATKPAAVLHSCLLGAGGDADHIVLGPVAVVVETKTGGGKVRWQNGTIVAGRRTIPGDAVAQVGRQVRALGNTIGLPVRAVICVPDMKNKPFQVAGTVVCSVRDLPGVLVSFPNVVSGNDARTIAADLRETHHRRQAELTARKAGRRPVPVGR